MKKFAINGRFTVRNLTGQERFAREIIRELDKLVKPSEVVLVVPKYAKSEDIPSYQNISVVRWGNVRSHFWEQIDFLLYLLLKRRTGINLCTTCPILKPDINTMHDINQKVNPQYFKSLYARLSTIWHSMMLYSSIWWGKKILTVSEFSKQEMLRVLNVNPDKIAVLGNGWQHINRISPDDGIFQKHPNLKPGEFYFAASSLTPQKNFAWIIGAARKNPSDIFAIAGKKEKLTNAFGTDIPGNLFFLGYVSDREMKALMQNCKAFIHPAFYEGFGIPPLEALANGAKVIVANAACLPEVFGMSAYYIDPKDCDVNFNQLLSKEVEPASVVLNKYSWTNEAKKLYNILLTL